MERDVIFYHAFSYTASLTEDISCFLVNQIYVKWLVTQLYTLKK